MARNNDMKLMPNKLSQISKGFVVVLLVLSAGLVGCSKTEPRKEVAAAPPQEMLPVLEIKEDQYTFSMYPQFETDSQSRLKFDIRDADGKFIRGASVRANLVAKDGHQQQTVFKEDTQLQKYIVQIPLKHHEDYVIDTSIDLRESGRTFIAKFSFHCCDPIPELLNEDTSIEGQRGASK